jgi:predicted nuclease of predicted toxin-antitoxin system
VTLRFLIDAQISPGLTQALRGLGHAAEHVFELGLADAPDSDVWQRAVRNSAVVVTKDIDFAIRRRASRTGPVAVWIRFGNTTKHALLKRLLPIIPVIVRAIEAGETLIEVR